MFELITPPAIEPLDLAELKQRLRVDHDEDDTLITSLSITARSYLERRLDRGVLDQAWRGTFSPRTGSIGLRPGRVREILTVAWRVDGALVALSTDDYHWHTEKPECLYVVGTPPSGADVLVVEFAVGAVTIDDVAPALVQAIAMLTAHYYEQRELVRADRYVSIPQTVEALIRPLQEVRL